MSQQYDDEINLADYLKVIMQRKVLIICGTIVPAICALIITFQLPPIYQTQTILEIGTISRGLTASLIENLSTVQIKIETGIYDTAISKQLSIKDEEYPKITVKNFEHTNLLLIKADSAKKELASKILKEMSTQILDSHSKLTEQAEKKWVQSINIIAPQFKVLKNKTISSADMNWLKLFATNLQPQTISETKIVKEPSIPPHRVFPNKKKAMVMAGAIGFILSVLLALFIDHVKNTTKEPA